MSLKKHSFKANEIPIYDDAVVSQRGEYWQMRMWLTKEKKYARFSLRTRNRDTAIDKAKKYYHELMAQQLAGKTYFSMTAKEGVEAYLTQRTKDMEAGLIVKGRLATIKTHLEHWLNFIGRDNKLKELERTDCENYYHSRTKKNKRSPISRTTVLNEQSTVNAMIDWLHKRSETYIDGFDFKKLPKIDTGDERNRRNIFTDEEIRDIKTALEGYIVEARRDLSLYGNVNKILAAYYLLISIITGMRRGEQLQLTWSDIEWLEKQVKGEEEGGTYSLIAIKVRGTTSKVRKTRRFAVKDWEYFSDLYNFQYARYLKANKDGKKLRVFGKTLIFSVDGISPLTPRVILYHFGVILDLCEIESRDTRNLVPYSFRHYFITDMVNKGFSPTQVSETCGTSTGEIEKTYYHTTEAKMITNAVPQYEYRDELLVPK